MRLAVLTSQLQILWMSSNALKNEANKYEGLIKASSFFLKGRLHTCMAFRLNFYTNMCEV